MFKFALLMVCVAVVAAAEVQPTGQAIAAADAQPKGETFMAETDMEVAETHHKGHHGGHHVAAMYGGLGGLYHPAFPTPYYPAYPSYGG